MTLTELRSERSRFCPWRETPLDDGRTAQGEGVEPDRQGQKQIVLNSPASPSSTVQAWGRWSVSHDGK